MPLLLQLVITVEHDMQGTSVERKTILPCKLVSNEASDGFRAGLA